MGKYTLMYDQELTIATGYSAASKAWKNTKIRWSDLVNKLANPVITAETYKQFISATKDEQSKIKDVGGYVGGFLVKGRREKSNVLYRSILTLDVDFSHENFWWDFTMLFDCAAVLHSTHKSNPNRPRHRLIIPLEHEVGQEEYQAIARKIAGDCNIELFDQSTFEVNRLMFWPSISSDAEYYFQYQDGPFLSPDYVLGLYKDWHDTTEWPTSIKNDTLIKQELDKQENPTDKKGIVGLFCRTYSIQDAISTFLSDVYEPTTEGRYTYIKGSTASGLVIYDNVFAYSHHGTDPAGGRLCNAFDLVRIHKFGMLDEPGAKSGRDLKSYRAMEDFAANDPLVRRHISEERLADAKIDFAEMNLEEPYDDSWTSELTANAKGEYESSGNNLNLIMSHDKYLKDSFKFNQFDNRKYIVRSVPWRKIQEPEPMRDVDYSGIRNYIDCIYGISASQKIDDAINLAVERNRFHPIRDYLNSLEWDGVCRVDTLLIDYFGADDTLYTRAAMRKILCAAVARVFVPGTKFDTALILVGEQGTYKSTFLSKLGRSWFSDTFTTVQGKEAFEQLQGAWIIEMAELSGLKKAEVEAIKHYLSKSEDQFRAAYARTPEVYKRQCVFFGTTNNKDFLRDTTGNRRFMPVDLCQENATKSVVKDLTDYEIDQIWAEAYCKYKDGEKLFLSPEEDCLARIEQAKHSETDERKGIIENYLNKLYPDNWSSMDLYQRMQWLDDPIAKKGTIQKDFTCVAEIWCECLGKNKEDMSRYNTREINEIMRSMADWEFISSTRIFPIYGKQKYYRRRDSLL